MIPVECGMNYEKLNTKRAFWKNLLRKE